MSELKPCPFCGGEAELTGFEAPEVWVWCPNCKASTDAHTCKGGAIEAWNTRAERTCHIEGRYGNKYCTCCGEMVGTWDSTSELYVSGNMVELWNYCPNCGARVTPKNSETTPKVVSE